MDADPSKSGAKMTTFGDDYEQLENCGVDFDYTCLNRYEEEYGECEEGDQECIARYLRRQNSTVPSNLYSMRSLAVSNYATDKTSRRMSSSISPGTPVSPTVLPPVLPPPFEGLPKSYFKKNFKPDYPAELQMKRVCAPKPSRRRTLGSTHTHPKAVFIPSYSTLQNQEMRSVPSSPAAFSTSGKSIPKNNDRTSLPKSGAGRDIFTDEPSPLEQNRLPPPVVSSSDEVVVDWIESHNVQMMFEYFLGLCVIYQPEDPWEFISQICGKMMEARNDLGAFDKLPRILAPEHTEAIFRIYDRIENGYITVPQYKSAMEAMGLNEYSASPEGWEENAISKDTFVQEATDAINNLLRTFMVCEEQAVEDKGSSVSQELQKTKSTTGKQPETSSGSRSSSSYTNSKSGTGSDGTPGTGGSVGMPEPVNSFTAEEEVEEGEEAEGEEDEEEEEEEEIGTGLQPVASKTGEGDGTGAPEPVASVTGEGEGTGGPEPVASTTAEAGGTEAPANSTTGGGTGESASDNGAKAESTVEPAPDNGAKAESDGTGDPDASTKATVAQ